MYSPKISEDLIPDLYKLSKALGKPMTALVNDLILERLQKTEIVETQGEIPRVTTETRIVYKIKEGR